ncbi:class I SAM-dependent methyltransferase [Akkermansiaceae bacterium]|nr:class I SAM-dependent methyltransferase [Akkermansiaceae bacterium]
MKNLRLPYDGFQIREVLFKKIIESEFRKKEIVEALEAGCGRKWSLTEANVKFKITGVDLDKPAYLIRKDKFNDIQEFHHMSLEDFTETERFDFVYCVDVLEHCHNTRVIFDNLIRSLKRGGIALIAYPNKNSIFGRITYHTPHWFHVLFYRFVYKNLNAGKSGYGPYPVIYEDFLEPKKFERSCEENSEVEIEYKITREYDHRRIGIFSYLYRPFASLIAVFFGKKTLTSGLIYIIRKS